MPGSSEEEFMKEHKVYRNIFIPIKILGLELMDMAVLAVVFLILFNLIDHPLVDVVLLVSVYGVLRNIKRNKPSGYLLHVVKYILNPVEQGVGLNDSLPGYPAGEGMVGKSGGRKNLESS